MIEAHQLSAWIQDAHQATLRRFEGIPDAQLLPPKIAIVNPWLWEVGHVAWFYEYWVLRHARRQERPNLDHLYNSSTVPHDTRWELALPSRQQTLDYLNSVAEAVVAPIGPQLTDDERYFLTLSVFHEDMHGEALLMTRQTLGQPGLTAWDKAPARAKRAESADVRIPGGTFTLGARRDAPFVFDNEKWAHPVEVQPFAIARTPVTQAQFLEFVEDAGYEEPFHWSTQGWQWRQTVNATRPLQWRQHGRGWERRAFERWVPLEPNLPAMHVSFYEAEAFCRWAGRRLPTELEWEVAARAMADPGARLGPDRRTQPWGESAAHPEHANLDARLGGPVDVEAFADGDSAFGCRQMVGNVWEWTSSDFLPFEGFSPDPYQDYSRPWFGTHKVLKGGSWATRARLARPGFRNFYTPDRRDPFAGFRTCAP